LRGSIAITFTEAAAAEMHERLAQTLADLARGKPPVWLPRAELCTEAESRAAALRDALEEPAAITIHAFARSLLARFPLEAGLQPGFAVDADGRERERVVRELVEETLSELLSRELDPRWAELFREQVAPQDIGEVLLGLFEAGAVPADLAQPRYDEAGIARWKSELGEALALALEEARPFAGGRQLTGETYALLQQLADALARFEGRTPEELEAWIRACDGRCPKNLVERMRKWGKADLTKGEERSIGAGTALAAVAALHAQLHVRLDERPALFEHARALLLPLLAEARMRLRLANVLGYQDLLREARDLLQDVRVRRTLQAEIRQLSVDEFQDTDELQCELVAALALDREAPQRPALFLVGDPKQSIYAWRSADLAAYEGFLAGLAPLRAERAVLSRNFRSTAALLAAVERWVAPRMRAEPGLQPAFQALEADRGETPAAPAVEVWIPWETAPTARARLGQTGVRRAAEIEAALLVRDLEERHAEGAAWKDCAVLVRARAHMPDVLEALRARGIPHEVAGDRSYYRRREIVDALSWIAAAIDPNDHVALLGALRSSACGLPDAALPALWAEQFPVCASRLRGGTPADLAPLQNCVREAARSVPREVGGRALPESWVESLLDALETLGLLRSALAEAPLARFFELLRSRTLFEASESARYQGDWRAENLERLYQRLARWLEERHGDLDELLALVREDLANERETEIARPEELETDSVRVLTIHGAKGLEFRHVYLLGLGRGPGHDARKRVELARLAGQAEVVLFGIPGPRWHACAARRARVRAAEEVRTLYVALTRAKDRVVLSGVWPEAPADHPPALQTLLGLLLESADPAWYPAVCAAADSGAELPREEQLLFRLPRPEELAELVPAGRAAESGEPAPIDAAGAVAARERARAHAARRWTASPSQLATDEEDGPWAVSSAPTGREAGSALHRALEQWNFAADPRAECLRLARAEPAARELLERFASGPLCARFLAAGCALVARELSFIAQPEAGEASCALSGSIDLLYRDPDGRLVVVDYKSDALEGPGALDLRARHHAPQLQAYVRALARALPNEKPPRAELWFLAAGEVRILE
jgi:ATP-dependent helicase/nuclease subunit A